MQAVHRGIMSSVMEKIMSMESRLHDASLNGNVHILYQLIQEDELTLARVSTTCFNETPLHIAAMLGHLAFAKAVVGYVPQLVAEQDCKGFTPLHFASVNGYAEIVKLLLQMSSDECVVRDVEGRTPLHLAIMKGRIDVAKELIHFKPEAVKYTLNATGETLLHLAVKYNRFNCLKMLVERAGESRDVLNAKDNNGNTILHLAACLKQTETVKYLLEAKVVAADAVNANGFTALDIVENMPRDLNVMEIRESLMIIPRTAAVARSGTERSSSRVIASQNTSRNVNPPKIKEDWADKRLAGLTVAATVIASMAYQAVLSPPGGVWDSDSKKGEDTDKFGEDTDKFTAGTSILSTKHSALSHLFWICNTISFMSSLTILFLLVSGFSLKRKFLVCVLMVSMWMTITSMTFSYAFSMWALQHDPETTSRVATTVLYGWLLFLFVVFAVHIVRFFVRVFIRIFRKLRRRGNTSRGQVNENV